MTEPSRQELADDPRHPSRYAYVHLKCRCALCTEENRVYMIGQRRRALESGGFPHGMVGYRYGCRCEPCRAAKAVANAKYHRRLAGRDASQPEPTYASVTETEQSAPSPTSSNDGERSL